MIHRKTILNLLLLLKKEPVGFQALYDSGCFYHVSHLDSAVSICLRAGLIGYEIAGSHRLSPEEVLRQSLHKRRWHNSVKYFFITSLGSRFLSYYDGCQVQKVIRRCH